MFKRRLGTDPHAAGKQTEAALGCPDIWELDDGDFAVIGITMGADAIARLPASASVGDDETMVRLPRRVLANAKADIPTS